MLNKFKSKIRYLAILLPLIIIVPLLLIAASGELEDWEVFLISLLVVAVAQIVRWVVQLLKKEKMNKRVAYIIALVVSIALAALLRMPTIPPFPGWDKFFTWINEIVDSIDGLMFWAVLIYNLFLPELLKKLEDIIEKKLILKVGG